MHFHINTTYISAGGVGGSGTRLVAEMLDAVGVNIGNDLNESRDHLTFTFLFKDPKLLEIAEQEFLRRVQIFLKSLHSHKLSDDETELVLHIASDPSLHSEDWLKARAAHLLSGTKSTEKFIRGPLGWKEPNTHVFVSQLLTYIPRFKYIHLVRNGLYMTYSQNQNQTKLWGPYFNGRPLDAQRASIEWWCHVHNRMRGLQEQKPAQILLLRFEDIVALKHDTFRSFLNFLEIEPTNSLISILSSLVKASLVKPLPPEVKTIILEPHQKACLASFDYDV